MRSDHPALLDVLARLATAVGRAASALERLAPPATESRHPVVLALAEAYGGSVFASTEAVQLAAGQFEASSALGQMPPALPQALAASGVRGPHALGRLLASLEGFGVERAGTGRSGTLWSVAVSKPRETARTLRAAPAPR